MELKAFKFPLDKNPQNILVFKKINGMTENKSNGLQFHLILRTE